MKSKVILIDDAGGGVSYIGTAFDGAAVADPAWRIMRIDQSANPTSVSYADGDDRMDKIWSNRGTYTYS